MNLTRCENGHFYDGERFDTCPHCNQTTISTVLQDADGNREYTMPLSQPAPPQPLGSSSLLDEVTQLKSRDDGYQATIGYFGEVEIEPVVGWLVAVTGNHKGQDFKLKTGRNFIGRSEQMDVALTGDASISREKHAIILYEPKSNFFLVQPGDARELFYLNDKVVLSATVIEAYDVITLGNTKLLFVPCCSEKFKWDSTDSAEEK